MDKIAVVHDFGEWLVVAGVAAVAVLVETLRRVGTARSAQRRRAAHWAGLGDKSDVSPGQYGPNATVEVARGELDLSRIVYSPRTNGDIDPGEVVWTWVPYEENDGRGKDRPFLILERQGADRFLGVYLTSKPHDDKRRYVSVGQGPWDAKGRPSWVNVTRIFRVTTLGIRRGDKTMPRAAFDSVVRALG